VTAPQRSDPDWRAALRQRGLRLTPQRELVLHAVRALGHATPDQVLEHVQQTATGVNASTVYRTLDLLEELRLVRHTHLGHGPPTYHFGGSADHFHIVCRECGRITEVPDGVAADFAEQLRAHAAFETDMGHLTVFGRCVDCSAASKAHE
jgi:Fur family ferric uptake transcriptional regulator